MVIKNIIFDLGGVLIDWNPKYLYRKVFSTEEKVDWFLENVCTFDWNEKMDAGRSFREAISIKVQEFPEYAKEIRYYGERWVEMLGGPNEETVGLLNRLYRQKSLRLFALTNWSAETFPYALDRYEFLRLFEDIVVSGEEKLKKPDSRIYKIILERNGIKPKETVFLDDNLRNVNAATELGIHSIHFQSARQLEESLIDLQVTIPK